MKTRFIILILFVVFPFYAFSQRSLEIQDISTGMNVFSGKDTEAGIVISAPSTIPLTFESTHDKVVDVFNKEIKGEEQLYYIRFNTGKRYRGRKLTIITNEYLPLTIMAELEPKELKQYKIVDPDAEFVYGCYYEYRKRGTEYFQNSMYEEAKEQYLIAKECSDCPVDANLDELIANIDSIFVYQKQADDAYDLLDYRKSATLYSKILTLNPSDAQASQKRFESITKYTNDCQKYFNMAEVYKDNGEYDKALELYDKIVNENCNNALVASTEAKKIRILMNSRKQRVKVYAYEYSKNTPIGITTGSYKNKKVGGYFSLSVHQSLFKALQKDYAEVDNPELNISFGWTVNPVSSFPLWIFFGPGYTGIGEFVDQNGNKYLGEESESGESESEDTTIDGEDTDPTFKIYSAISPEVGLLGKIGPLVLRYTFQYRFAISKEYEDKIKSTRHVFGVGFCF